MVESYTEGKGGGRIIIRQSLELQKADKAGCRVWKSNVAGPGVVVVGGFGAPPHAHPSFSRSRRLRLTLVMIQPHLRTLQLF